MRSGETFIPASPCLSAECKYIVCMVRAYEGDRTRVNFYFDTEVFDGMKWLAVLKGTTYSELIRQACREYIARHTAQAETDKQQLQELNK